MQGHSSTVGLVTALLAEVNQNRSAKGRLTTTVQKYITSAGVGPISLGVAFLQNPLTTLWTAFSDVDRTLKQDAQFLLLAVDEITEAIRAIGRTEGHQAAKDLLGVLRRMREELSQVRWIMCGSIGFHHVLREIGSTQNVLTITKRAEMGPLSAEWAQYLATCLMMGLGHQPHDAQTQAIVEALAENTDGIAMLIHMFAEHVKDNEIDSFSAEQVQGMLDECFVSSGQDANLTHLLARILDYYGGPGVGTSNEIAHAILDATSLTSAQPVSHTYLLSITSATSDDHRLVIDNLIADHYLVKTTSGTVRWRYPSLARVWRLRRGLSL